MVEKLSHQLSFNIHKVFIIKTLAKYMRIVLNRIVGDIQGLV